MVDSNVRQLGILLWKNWLIQKRRVILTLFQILLPAAFALILFLIRTRVTANLIVNATQWDSFEANTALPQNLTLSPNRSPINYGPSTGARTVLDNRWRIAFAPNVSVSQRLVSFAANLIDEAATEGNGATIGIGFNSESDLESYFTNDGSSISTLCGIVFSLDSIDPSGDSLVSNDIISYKIRLRAEGYSATYVNTNGAKNAWQTNRMYARQLKPQPQGDKYGGNFESSPQSPGYYYEGFLAIQRAVDLSIMNELSEANASTFETVRQVDMRLKSFPYPPYADDAFIFILTTQFPFIVMLSFIVTAPTICKDVVLEKEKKLKESMKLMGMKAWLHWLAWFVKFAIFMIISVALMTLFFHIKFKDRAVITKTASSITFVFLLLYSLSIVTFCFAISTFFSKASAAAAAGGIIYLASYIPYFFLGTPERFATLSASTKAGCSIISNLAMGIGCQIIAAFESTGAGIQWSTINTAVNVDDNFTMLYTFLLLILDIIIYSLITWYFDAIIPGDFGTPLPFYFPFTKRYWCGCCCAGGTDDNRINDDDIDYGDKSKFFEEPLQNVPVGIRIRNLTKKFSKSQRPAVSKLSIDMYEGQITALLGHNGAGKTTTMFMLTGFLPPTSGTAVINGFDLRTDLAKIRENLGLCPQHDVLFDTLTVVEHLKFFALLKGCPTSTVNAEVDNMIRVLRLEDKRHVASKKLSGGMKRKLSVGIALIAGSKFVILDEPTSGMDPEARRQAWDILQSQRAGRTMILSTHFMDEADLLGDRIAIMADGQLQCCGSSLFLKGRYGIGYHLTIVKNPKCRVDYVIDCVRHHVPDAQLESNVGAELSFILPKEQSHLFERFFTDLEQNQRELGIDSFGASVTTLEEVFLKYD